TEVARHRGSILGRLAQLGEATGLHLADALAGEVHDLPHLLERDPALLRHVERAGVLQLPDFLVREVELDRPRLWIHVQVEVVLAGDEEARPRPVDAVRPRPWTVLVDAPEQLLLLGTHPPGEASPAELARHLLPRHRLRSTPLGRSRERARRVASGVRRKFGLCLTHRFPPPDRWTPELAVRTVTTDRFVRWSRPPAAR